jgi:D-sedoheptulose 7-phosphate isomerase
VTILDAFDEHRSVLERSRALMPALLSFVEVAHSCLSAGGKLLVCGNGGSAADAQHFAAEMIGRFERERRALPAIALTTDTSALTAIANDYGYDRVFERQLEALARKGDVVVVMSTSGKSPSVLAVATRARALGCPVVALTGEGGGALGRLADIVLAVPSTNVARIQEIHGLCLHAAAQEIEVRVTNSTQP